MRLHRLIQRTGQWQTDGRVSKGPVARDRLDGALLRREATWPCCSNAPKVHERLLHAWRGVGLHATCSKHPGVIDELAGNAMLEGDLTRRDFERELEARKPALKGTQPKM